MCTGPSRAPVVRAENESDYRVDASDEDLDAGVDTRQFVVAVSGHGERLDKLLVAHAGEFSRNHLQGLIERGCVCVDGVVSATASRRLRAGQAVSVELQPTDESRAFIPEAMTLAIRHEDEHLLVLAKPAGLVVHPAPGNWRGTLLNGLLAHHGGAMQLPRAGIVHRLDKNTSGLMMVAKSLPAMTALVRAIAAREVHREYAALVHGDVGVLPFSIDAPIGRDPVSRVRMAVVAGAKPAKTDVARVAWRDGLSAVRCTLHTGRTHQIRVHLASRGHPLVADAMYGGKEALGLVRQALHAARLRLQHPIADTPMAFDEPLPADLASAWAQVCD